MRRASRRSDTDKAKRDAYARKHPVRFVLKRVAAAGAEIVIGVLGISAILAVFIRSLLPRLDLPTFNLGRLPDIDPPSWLRYLDIGHWLHRLGLSWPDIAVPRWIAAILDHRQYWLPVVIALLVALGEVDRRRKRDANRDADPNDDPPAPQ